MGVVICIQSELKKVWYLEAEEEQERLNLVYDKQAVRSSNKAKTNNTTALKRERDNTKPEELVGGGGGGGGRGVATVICIQSEF